MDADHSASTESTEDPTHSHSPGVATATQDVPPEFQPEPASPDDIRRASVEARDAAADDRDMIRRAAAHGERSGDAKKGVTVEGPSVDEQMSALDWFMDDDSAPAVDEIELNIGTSRNRRWIDWTICAVDTDVLKRIRRDAEGNRARRRSRTPGETDIDPQEANLRIVLAGTLAPDLRDIAKRKGAPEHVDPDVAPLQLLKHRFRQKPGLIDQLAGEIMSLSGYDEDDLREHLAGKA